MVEPRQAAGPEHRDEAREGRRQHADLERHQEEDRPGMERPAAGIQRVVVDRAVPLQPVQRAPPTPKPAGQHGPHRDARGFERQPRQPLEREGREGVEQRGGRRPGASRSGPHAARRDRRTRRAGVDGRSCGALPVVRELAACRASRRPARAARSTGTGRRRGRAAPNRIATSPRSSGERSATGSWHVAVRQRVPDDQDALEPHADVDDDRDHGEHRAGCAARPRTTTAPAARRSCRRAAPSRAAHSRP